MRQRTLYLLRYQCVEPDYHTRQEYVGADLQIHTSTYSWEYRFADQQVHRVRLFDTVEKWQIYRQHILHKYKVITADEQPTEIKIELLNNTCRIIFDLEDLWSEVKYLLLKSKSEATTRLQVEQFYGPSKISELKIGYFIFLDQDEQLQIYPFIPE